MLSKRFYQISGRAGRTEFWCFALFWAPANALLFLVTRFIPIAGELIFATAFIVLLCLICAMMHRFRDLCFNGPIAVIPPVPMVLSIAAADLAMRLDDEDLKEAAICSSPGFLLFAVAFAVLLSKKAAKPTIAAAQNLSFKMLFARKLRHF